MTKDLQVQQEQNVMFNILDSVDVGQIQQTMSNIVKFQTVIQKALKPGHDHDVISGTGKSTLLKPGAEKILMLLGLTSEYEIVKQIEDYDKGIFAYTMRCILSKNGFKITEGVGSCNSKEDKYHWRWVREDDLPLGTDKNTLKNRITKYGQTQYRIENDEIYSQANTILKMAKKRSQIDATLTVAALSEIFTQDLEDMKEFVQNEEIENMKPEEVTNIKVTFGKYKGQTLGEIAKKDTSYIEWLAKNARDDVMRKAADMLINGQPIQQPAETPQAPIDLPAEDDDGELPF